MKIASFIDHTLLAANAKKNDIIKICDEAKEYSFASVCVNSYWVSTVSKELASSPVNTCSVIGFPLGSMSTEAKSNETRQAITDGADEIDMVINIGELKAGNYKAVEIDIKTVKAACEGKLLKVIIETCLLTDEEKVKACHLSVESGADFVKTSTGFSTGGATAKDVTLMRSVVGDKIGVKASGGIHSYEEAKKMIDAGASRIGASSGIKIVKAENTI
jgi:deoxyribose-phosphate aldolase